MEAGPVPSPGDGARPHREAGRSEDGTTTTAAERSRLGADGSFLNCPGFSGTAAVSGAVVLTGCAAALASRGFDQAVDLTVAAFDVGL